MGFGPHDALSAVELHQPRTVCEESVALHGEVAGRRGEQPDRLPEFAECSGIVAVERIDVIDEEVGDFLVNAHARSRWVNGGASQPLS
ncbi:hypothetical protein [Falsiroseomonas tokyonensis]|uniref:hypothetical protein n=1 Tax=Falsiroseomonas tokyonensis TaxID=430521 RepID=UPI001C20343F|nr:hypothetical protein [Falsiroseomonas tokyonensis]